MAKRKPAQTRQAGKLLAMDTATLTQRELVGTTEAAQILGVGVSYLRKLARDGDVWSDHRFGKRCPVYDAAQLRKLAIRFEAERKAGLRVGRPPSGGPKP